MTPSEFRDWWEFYDLYPFDDEARHWRPAALIASAGNGYRFGEGKVSDNLRWLMPPPKSRYSQAELNSMAAFGIKPPR